MFLVLLLTLRAAFPRFARNPVRIPRSKIGKLTFQTQSVGIFALGNDVYCVNDVTPDGVADKKDREKGKTGFAGEPFAFIIFSCCYDN